MGCKLFIGLLVVALALVAGVGFQVYRAADELADFNDKALAAVLMRSDYASESSCVALRGMKGAEDGEVWRGHVILTNLDHANLWDIPRSAAGEKQRTNPSYAEQGIYVLYHASTTAFSEVKSARLEKASLVGFPSDAEMHSHGIHVRGDLLYVVNHAYGKGGERLDVFELSEENEGENVNVVLTFLFAIDFSTCCMGMMNDVVALSDSEIIVTKYLPGVDHNEGRIHSFKNAMKTFHTLPYISSLIGEYEGAPTSIYRCTLSEASKQKKLMRSEDVCERLPHEGLMWNGVAAHDEEDTFFVSDLLSKEVVQFKLTSNGVREQKRFAVPLHLDNIYYSSKEGLVYGGGVASLIQCMMHWMPKAISEVREHDALAGGNFESEVCPVHISTLDPSTGRTSVALLHDGSTLAALSFGLPVGELLVGGSFMDNGVLVCKK